MMLIGFHCAGVGVNGNNLGPDPPSDEEDQSVKDSNSKEPIDDDVNETSNNDGEMIDEDDDIDDKRVLVTPALKNLTDYNGTLPPAVMKSRTWSQANETGEHLLIGVREKTSNEDGFIEPFSKKQQKIRKKLEMQLFKRRAEELQKETEEQNEI